MDQIDTITYQDFTTDQSCFKADFILLLIIKWELLVINYSEDNIYIWGNFSIPCVSSHLTNIISIYLVPLHCSITCIFSMKYKTWHITNEKVFSMTVYSYNIQMGKWDDDDIFLRNIRGRVYWLNVTL